MDDKLLKNKTIPSYFNLKFEIKFGKISLANRYEEEKDF